VLARPQPTDAAGGSASSASQPSFCSSSCSVWPPSRSGSSRRSRARFRPVIRPACRARWTGTSTRTTGTPSSRPCGALKAASLSVLQTSHPSCSRRSSRL